MIQHPPAFPSALSEVTALLGEPSVTDRFESPPSGVAYTAARWTRGEVDIDLRVYDDGDRSLAARGIKQLSLVPCVDLVAAVRDLCARLSWSTCARTGYDANGSPVDDERTAVYARLAEVSR